MTDTNSIDSLNGKISLVKNLAWLAGALFAGAVALAAWTASKFNELTSGFIRYGDSVSIMTHDPNGAAFPLNVDLAAPVGNALRYGSKEIFIPYFRPTSEEPAEVLKIVKSEAE
ncbi:hypothetical protein OEZ71_01765 [Defluviimonas sp. WL0050]|uniref:Uncharacterized protein n=1 Tax=Albidovulum litorale TaxID=2984134 RepID=A0ABT2ZIR3_9RHOB|nr:hypothetical protein [Defluviimonas sp. WL0050]MCV2871014.1 hypothetical protein [Defluviimonas sp. WL0050]